MPDWNAYLGLELSEREKQLAGEVVELALTALSFVFLGLLVVEYAAELSEAWSRRVQLAGYIIWAVFATEFVIRFALADEKKRYLQSNWLAGLAVVLPLFRVFRAARAVRAARSLRLARLVTGTNRGRSALGRMLGRGGVGYVLLLTVVVLVLSGSGIYSLERDSTESTIDSWAEGIWWSATTVATLGSEHQPATVEGRVLAFLVMLYGLGISGYVTAVLAVFLLGLRERSRPDDAAVADELRALRAELQSLRGRPGG